MKKKGKGIACQIFNTHIPNIPNPTGAFLDVNFDGTVQITVGTSEIGQGAHTILAQIAAEELGVPIENVSLTGGDTESGLWCMASAGSRVTYIGGNAVRQAASKVKEMLIESAAEMLNMHPSALEVKDGRIYVKGTPEKGVTIGEAAFYSQWVKGKLLIASSSFSPTVKPLDPETGEGVASASYSWNAQIAEVEVDTETGEVQVSKFAAACDCGKAINPAMIEGQIEGGVQMGIGYALMEQMLFDEKYRHLNPNFTDYLIPTASDVPEIKCVIVEKPEPTGPFGAKGIGESVTCPTAPAICNAIFDAIGVRITSLPATPEKILKGLKEKT